METIDSKNELIGKLSDRIDKLQKENRLLAHCLDRHLKCHKSNNQTIEEETEYPPTCQKDKSQNSLVINIQVDSIISEAYIKLLTEFIKSRL